MTERIGLSWPADATKIVLGGIEVDLRYRVVRRMGVAHELNPRTFDLLSLFLREPRVLHAREAIFAKIWPGVIVEDASLSTCVWMLRRAFGNDAKQWIRTVSKQGYVFDPPCEIRLVEGDAGIAPSDIVDPLALLDADDDTREPAFAARPRVQRWAKVAALAALVACATSMTVLRGGASRAPIRVALVLADGTGGETAPWPALLLRAWLDWQVRSLPDLLAADASDACGACSEVAVLLEVDAPARRDGEWRVAARFRGDGRRDDIEQHCSEGQLVSAIDAVGRAALHELEPSIDAAAFPALSIDAATARDVVDGLAHERRHRWGDAVRAYAAIAERDADFGWVQLRLAASLAEIGQRSGAERALERALSWLDALPPALQRPARAQQAFLRQDYAAAAAAFASLQSSYARNLPVRLDEADSLRRAGRIQEAAVRVEGEPPAGASGVRWLIRQAEIALSNRDPQHAATAAEDAIALADHRDWPHDRAQATLLLADARLAQGDAPDPALYQRAATDYERSGDRLGALSARLQADLQGTEAAAREPAHLDELLSEARLAGNTDVEIDALRRTALFHDRAGDIARARERFAQAAAVADTAGNAYERRKLDLNLLQEDALRLDFAMLDHRLAALRAEAPQGGIAVGVGLQAARLAYLRGDFEGALARLTEAEAAVRDGDRGRAPHASTIGCMRAAVHMMQGRTAEARDDVRDCRSSGVPVLDHFADIAEAELAIHTGDLAQARRLLEPMRETLRAQANEVDRWNLTIEIAPLLARAGELDVARALLDEMLPALERSGYRLIVADARVTRAEIALADARLDDAAREAALGGALVPADDWYEMRRLRTVHALLAQARGEPEAAAQMLQALHADARRHEDVLAELLVHSLMSTRASFDDCPEARRAHLVAQSGLRGASDLWMNPAAHGHGALAKAAQ
ncbi:MAG TPA: winged helix-turn-helix domain-containing protein [Dokdonella sp.]|nr:winged helix-turn-helix domain-containing protein [Dokdonella sp.]